MKKLSVVVSIYNEEVALEQSYLETSRVLEQIDWEYELLSINDGSRDNSLGTLRDLSERDSRVEIASFSRNFGHEAAMIVGVDYATGDGIIYMDADLQYPPACIPEIIRKFEDGFEVVSVVRTKNDSAGWFKDLVFSTFHRLINISSDVKFESNASDFFAISGRVDRVPRNNYREKVRFLRGYVQNVGFRKATLEYEARARVAGQSKYSICKLVTSSVNTILCFSSLSLKLGTFVGVFAALLGIFVLVYTLFTRNEASSGYATIVVMMCFMFSLLFLVVGIIGEYIAVLFSEMKDRPIYIVENTVNLEER